MLSAYGIGHSVRGAFNDLKTAEKWVSDGMHPSQSKYVIERRGSPSGDFIGVIGLNQAGQLGYMLDPSAWGKGYATEALTAYLPTLFNLIPELEMVEAAAYEDNVGSRRVLEKCGFIATYSEARWDQTEGEPDGSRQEKIRKLKHMVQGMGLQSSGVDARQTKGIILLYRYTKQT